METATKEELVTWKMVRAVINKMRKEKLGKEDASKVCLDLNEVKGWGVSALGLLNAVNMYINSHRSFEKKEK